MTKIGRKGFMLAEVVIIAVVVATVLVTLYIGLNNVVSAYDTRNRYYDVDCLYAAIETNNVLLKNYPETIRETIDRDTAINLSSTGDVNSFKDFYEGAVNDIINLYLTPYDKYEMLSIKNFENTNVTFDEYLDYLSGNLNFDADYNYMIIVERLDNKDSNDCYYYALKLKY